MSYYDIATDSIVVYKKIDKPTGLAANKSGLSGSTYTYYYAITFTSTAGETDESVHASITSTNLRPKWNNDNSATIDNYVNLSWDANSDATGVYVYTGTDPDHLEFIAALSGDSTGFKDDGSYEQSVNKTPPPANSTQGPIIKYTVDIIGQLYGWGDRDKPELVWYDGGQVSPDYSGNFTVARGGGYVGVFGEDGSYPVAVLPFSTGKGDPVPTVVCGEGIRHITLTAENRQPYRLPSVRQSGQWRNRFTERTGNCAGG
jgi:hypothetical protein